MDRIIPLALLLAIPTLGACTPADSIDPDAVVIEDGWARATAPGQDSAAAYLTIANRGSQDRRLTAVLSDRGAASLHHTQIDGGVASMRPIEDGITIPAGEEIRLQPQGDHVMLKGLDEPLEAGQSFALTLEFETLEPQQAAIEVVEPGSR